MSNEIAPTGLTDLATKIKAAHSEVVGAMRNTVRKAIAAGDLLIAAKDRMPYGDWEAWLEGQCALPKRTAQLYMRLAKGKGTIEAHMAQAGTGNATVAHLTLNEASALLGKGKDKSKPQPSASSVVASAGDHFLSALNDLKKTSDQLAKSEAAKLVERLQKAEFLAKPA
jgi:hypothetical protein